MKHYALALSAILFAAGPASAASGPYCGDVSDGWDHRTATEDMRDVVNRHHFNDDVQNGIKGQTGALAGSDLSYTLRKFPNHPRALEVLLRIAPRYQKGAIPGLVRPLECWFERAVRFAPDDAAMWGFYARYNFMFGNDKQGTEMLVKALELDPDNPSFNYNYGLALTKVKKYDEALKYAHKAYVLGFPLPGLKQKLTNAGKWVEPPPLEEKPAAASAAASAASAPEQNSAPATPTKP
ncbi:MAG TPA: tetratricopeptide repeat protein [Burkholderiaceae bacterium]